MTKKIRIGVSAMVAFALMFATSVDVVAQEKVATSTDDVEVKGSMDKKIKAYPSSAVTGMWYKLKISADETDVNDALDPSNYEAGQETEPCGEGEVYCAIFANPNGTQPDQWHADNKNTDPRVTILKIQTVFSLTLDARSTM